PGQGPQPQSCGGFLLGALPLGALPLGALPLGAVPLKGSLAGPTARTLAWDDGAVLEDLATPHAPGLLPGQRAVQARKLDRAMSAQLLGPLQLSRGLGEPQIRVLV